MTTENNEIIAEFMDWEQAENNMFDFPEKFNDPLTLDYHCIEPSLMKFHSDWNWLMEVVEKIESLKPIAFLTGRNWQGFEVKIYKTLNTGVNYCTINYIKESGNMTISNGFSKESKIQAVYNACVEFIKWYNEQKKD